MTEKTGKPAWFDAAAKLAAWHAPLSGECIVDLSAPPGQVVGTVIIRRNGRKIYDTWSSYRSHGFRLGVEIGDTVSVSTHLARQVGISFHSEDRYAESVETTSPAPVATPALKSDDCPHCVNGWYQLLYSPRRRCEYCS